MLSDGGLKNLIEKLQTDIALDTVRNEYLMRAKLYAWLIEDRGRGDLETFNKKVYSELFLTPASDPWLGLFQQTLTWRWRVVGFDNKSLRSQVSSPKSQVATESRPRPQTNSET